jgi:hypothetical protein
MPYYGISLDKLNDYIQLLSWEKWLLLIVLGIIFLDITVGAVLSFLGCFVKISDKFINKILIFSGIGFVLFVFLFFAIVLCNSYGFVNGIAAFLFFILFIISIFLGSYYLTLKKKQKKYKTAQHIKTIICFAVAFISISFFLTIVADNDYKNLNKYKNADFK